MIRTHMNLRSSMIFVGLAVTALISQAQPAAAQIVVTLAGHGVAVSVSIPGVPTPGACFQANLYNTDTGEQVGTGIDCIDVKGVDAAGTGFSVNRTTIFNFYDLGMLVANGLTTVVPIFGASSPGFTHVVGDADPSTSNIIYGTGIFRESMSGDARLSGIVNLSKFPDTVGFNCIFVLRAGPRPQDDYDRRNDDVIAPII